MHNIDEYNIKWDSQSRHSGESMPVGGHDIGLNVWVEKGDLLFLVDRSGSFDENNQMLKLGRVRVRLEPNPFVDGAAFSQELKLKEGYQEITGITAGGLEVRILLWVEVFSPVVHIEINSNRPIKTELHYENWRQVEREVPDGRDSRMPMMSMVTYPGKVITRTDEVNFSGDDVVFYHRNRSDDLAFDKVVELENLKPYQDQMWNPQLNTTFGGLLRGEGMTTAGTGEGIYIQTGHKSWKLVSTQPREFQHAALYLHTGQTETVENWLEQLNGLVSQASLDIESSKDRTRQWWRQFWERSHIIVDGNKRLEDARPWQVGRNYNLFRYMLGCNAFGEYPTKFNGGLFTSDPSFVIPGPAWEARTPDFRRWGGGSFTAQNQRLVYWPMLKSGDFEMMKPQFEFYRRALGNAELRTKVYWGHEGASFTEQIENFGLPLGWAWGWYDSDSKHSRTRFDDPTEQTEPYVKYLYLNQLDFSFMIMKYHLYSGADISAYLPFIESSIRFFDEHYQYIHFNETDRRLDVNGKLVLFPSTACETYKMALNPTDLVAALDATVRAILELPENYLNEDRKAYYRELLNRLPAFTFREKAGKTTIAPAESWKEIINVEIPQLYPVFPYEQYGLGRPGLQVAIDTWHYGTDIPEQKSHASWHQDNIFCARLGLADEAAALTIQKLADGNFRFPAFWGPGHDWLPDHNWGGTGMIGLQEMLLQTNGEQIYLLPAWPRDWEVDFKLQAPHQTVVEGSVRNGKLVELVVTPEKRRADIINLWESKLDD
ncbi:MAG: six-hairpin glycosidase-like family protein [Chloroflexi bacterium]|nr:six-hairpin glycosidase-like family protein [Chloroflexota bacterium]